MILVDVLVSVVNRNSKVNSVVNRNSVSSQDFMGELNEKLPKYYIILKKIH